MEKNIDLHARNINEIMKLAQCDEDSANEIYKIGHYNLKMSIEFIQSTQTILSTQKNRQLTGKEYVLTPLNNYGEYYKTAIRNKAYIPEDDFMHLLEIIKTLYPKKNIWKEEIDANFEIKGHNYLDKETCKILIEKLQASMNNSEDVNLLKKEIINWLNSHLIAYNYIVIYYNSIY